MGTARTEVRADAGKVAVNPRRAQAADKLAPVAGRAVEQVASQQVDMAQAVALYPCCIAPADVAVN